MKSLVAGMLAGLLNGMFGGGGGVVLAPLLHHWKKLEEKHALSTALAVMLPVSLLSAILYGCAGRLNILAALPYMIGGTAGGLLAGKWFKVASPTWLTKAFGLLLCIAGAKMILG